MPATMEDFIGGAAIVPQDSPEFLRNLRNRNGQSARIWSEQNVEFLVAKKPEGIVARTMGLTAVVVPDQADKSLVCYTNWNTTLSIHQRLPEEKARSALVVLAFGICPREKWTDPQ